MFYGWKLSGCNVAIWNKIKEYLYCLKIQTLLKGIKGVEQTCKSGFWELPQHLVCQFSGPQNKVKSESFHKKKHHVE